MMTERRGSVFHCEEQGKGRGKCTVTVDSQASTAAPYALPATGSVSSSGNTCSHGPRRLGRRLPLHLAVAVLAAADGEQACERGGTRECGAWQCEWNSWRGMEWNHRCPGGRSPGVLLAGAMNRAVVETSRPGATEGVAVIGRRRKHITRSSKAHEQLPTLAAL